MAQEVSPQSDCLEPDSRMSPIPPPHLIMSQKMQIVNISPLNTSWARHGPNQNSIQISFCFVFGPSPSTSTMSPELAGWAGRFLGVLLPRVHPSSTWPMKMWSRSKGGTARQWSPSRPLEAAQSSCFTHHKGGPALLKNSTVMFSF